MRFRALFAMACAAGLAEACGGNEADATVVPDDATSPTATGGAAPDAAGKGGASPDAAGKGGAGGSGGAGGAFGGGGAAPKDASGEAISEASGPWPPDSGRAPVLGDKDAKGRVLVFQDEFDGTTLDPVWHKYTTHEEGSGMQTYSADAVSLENGNLVIKATAASSTSATSGSISTKGKIGVLYGYIEARIKTTTATGTWPAFWLLPETTPYGGWPTSGEIDVMEYVSQDPNGVYGTPHYVLGGQHVSTSEMSNRLQLTDPVSNDFHVFAIDWTPTKIEWYCDGVLYNRLSIASAFDGRYPFAYPFYLIVMMQIGGGWPPAPNPAEYPDTMLTDWVRVWQLPGTDGGIGP